MRRLRARDATDSPALRTQRRKWKAQAPLAAAGRIDAFELAQERGSLHQAVGSTCTALAVAPCGLQHRLRYVTQRRRRCVKLDAMAASCVRHASSSRCAQLKASLAT